MQGKIEVMIRLVQGQIEIIPEKMVKIIPEVEVVKIIPDMEVVKIIPKVVGVVEITSVVEGVVVEIMVVEETTMEIAKVGETTEETIIGAMEDIGEVVQEETPLVEEMVEMIQMDSVIEILIEVSPIQISKEKRNLFPIGKKL